MEAVFGDACEGVVIDADKAEAFAVAAAPFEVVKQ